ncbi:MAG TPA: ABC transporter permease, partial [Spirochaetia bacterium]|nr:ABC transporter permease [Spirochaetia bacterium]
YIEERWATFFLILLIVAFSLVGRNFFAVKNFSNILYFATTYALLSAGETFVIVTGGIDLSVGFVMGFVNVVSAIVMRDMYAAKYSETACMVAGTLVGLVVGILPGLINGLLVARLRVPPFIATLGMYGVANGLALSFSQGFPIYFVPPSVQKLGNSFISYLLPGKSFSFFERPPNLKPDDIRAIIGLVPSTVLVAGVILVVAAFVLARTRFGQHTYAIGGSKDAAIRSGINVPRHLVWVYILSSLFASLAGIIYVFRIGIGNFTTFNSSYELFAIAGVVIGGASLMGGKGTIGGALIGTLILMTLEDGLNIVGIQAFFRYIATGLILIAAVVIDQFTAERRSSFA